MNEKIDFVLLWVDGNDPEWLKEKEKYSSSKNLGTSNTKNRFRDWNNLQYWFRAVEKYSSWVNKIFFVTWGHVPSWLKENKKLQIVKHEDFIPKEYLPTFNSNTIILNLHRIKGLSENFVLFNDDMFLNDYVKETDFFINGIPRDQFSYNLISSTGNENDSFNHMLLNNIDIINKYFKKADVTKRNIFKIFNLKYSLNNNIKSFLLLAWEKITGFENPHIAYSYKKETFSKLWELELITLHNTCKNKFRGLNDVTDWLIRYWQLCTSNFKPRKSKFGVYLEIKDENERIKKVILEKKAKLICLNDVGEYKNFNKTAQEIIEIFETTLPNKSEFEK